MNAHWQYNIGANICSCTVAYVCPIQSISIFDLTTKNNYWVTPEGILIFKLTTENYWFVTEGISIFDLITENNYWVVTNSLNMRFEKWFVNKEITKYLQNVNVS